MTATCSTNSEAIAAVLTFVGFLVAVCFLFWVASR